MQRIVVVVWGISFTISLYRGSVLGIHHRSTKQPLISTNAFVHPPRQNLFVFQYFIKIEHEKITIQWCYMQHHYDMCQLIPAISVTCVYFFGFCSISLSNTLIHLLPSLLPSKCQNLQLHVFTGFFRRPANSPEVSLYFTIFFLFLCFYVFMFLFSKFLNFHLDLSGPFPPVSQLLRR